MKSYFLNSSKEIERNSLISYIFKRTKINFANFKNTMLGISNRDIYFRASFYLTTLCPMNNWGLEICEKSSYQSCDFFGSHRLIVLNARTEKRPEREEWSLSKVINPILLLTKVLEKIRFCIMHRLYNANSTLPVF